MVLKYLLSYIKLIGLSSTSFELLYRVWLLLLLLVVISMCVCEMMIILYPVHWLFLSLYISVYCCFHFSYCSSYVIGCFKTKCDYFVWLWYNYYLVNQVHPLSLYLFIIVCCFFQSELLQNAGWLFVTRTIILLVSGWSLSYIQFIDWFFTCLDHYAICFHMNFCSVYLHGCITRKNYFVESCNESIKELVIQWKSLYNFT